MNDMTTLTPAQRYYRKNKESIRKVQREYYLSHRDEYIKRAIKHYEENKEHHRIMNTQYKRKWRELKKSQI
jgi:hypothetical protein